MITKSMRKLAACVAVAAVCVVLARNSARANALGIPDTEYNALVDLYNSTGGPNWTNHDNWLTANTPWFGVTVFGGHVGYLELPSNNITGPIPTSIGQLIGLQTLDLSSNPLGGTIPDSIGALTSLYYLILQNDDLTGSIPASVGDLTQLAALGLNGNKLTGSIPPEVGNLSKLQLLSIGGSHLSGPVPPEIGNLRALSGLYLQNNDLTGPIPAEIGQLTDLTDLNLGLNPLGGSIPPAICSLRNLDVLSFEADDLTGPIPDAIGDLNKLVFLNLGGNQLSGPIPSGIGALTGLQQLLLFTNQLTGPIPAGITSLTGLQTLDLDGNHLDGTIPADIGNLTNLQELNLFDNQLSGTIPPSLGSLSNLQRLGLDRNKLIGPIPPEIEALTNCYLGLSYNALFADDPGVQSFLNSHISGWDNTQTVAPANAAVSSETANSVTVSWSPITYTSDPGYYEVGVSATAGGPFTFDPANRTTSKEDTSVTLSGPALGENWYFAVRSVTVPCAVNQNTVVSVPAQISSPPKTISDGTAVSITGAVVTADFPGFSYIEAPDRAWGIRVVQPSTGPKYPTYGYTNVRGVLGTDTDGERYIDASAITFLSPGHVTREYLSNSALGGGDSLYDASTGAGQQGITGGRGLNNIGLLVRTTGVVTSVDAAAKQFTIWDGSSWNPASPLTTPGGQAGILVSGPGLSSLNVTAGTYVTVTGISSCYKSGGAIFPQLLIRGLGDIVVDSP